MLWIWYVPESRKQLSESALLMVLFLIAHCSSTTAIWNSTALCELLSEEGRGSCNLYPGLLATSHPYVSVYQTFLWSHAIDRGRIMNLLDRLIHLCSTWTNCILSRTKRTAIYVPSMYRLGMIICIKLAFLASSRQKYQFRFLYKQAATRNIFIFATLHLK